MESGLEFGWGLLILLPLALLLFTIGVVIYLIPTIIAYKRSHPHTLIIALLNILLGGTLIVWVGCLIWALYDVKGTTPVRRD